MVKIDVVVDGRMVCVQYYFGNQKKKNKGDKRNFLCVLCTSNFANLDQLIQVLTSSLFRESVFAIEEKD